MLKRVLAGLFVAVVMASGAAAEALILVLIAVITFFAVLTTRARRSFPATRLVAALNARLQAEANALTLRLDLKRREADAGTVIPAKAEQGDANAQLAPYPHREEAAFVRLHALVQKGYQRRPKKKSKPISPKS